ncbi:MAG: SYNERG-CTERM sorting domain-containing protein, partial [Synergistaceae bacterium]|nr:SYNERG-CTERM sorting domain-containing protein [Synergistaceae bacterium]
AELAMETSVGSTDLYQGEETTVTITATPQVATGTYTFEFDDADDAFTITAGDEAQVSATTGNAVEYKVQAKINAKVGSHVVTFYVTSGDKEVSDNVTFTIKAFDDMSEAEQLDFAKEHPAPAPGFGGGRTLAEIQELFRNALANGEPFKFTMTSEWPVRPTGWRIRFMRGNSFFGFLLRMMRFLLGGNTYAANEAAFISAFSMIASEDEAPVAITVDAATDGLSAEYEFDPAQAAEGLTNGQDFGVYPAIIPEKYETLVADKTEAEQNEVASATEESLGTLTGRGSSTPTEPTEPTEPTDPTEDESVNPLLGGSSGGCDAGFGALALALAVTLFVSKKRS